MMRLQISLLQKVKTAVHAIAAFSIFIAACITIAILAGGGPLGGRPKFYFAVCFLSIPALAYLIAAPIWPRASGVARAVWFLIVDVLYTFLWLVAFACVLAFSNSGVKEGAKRAKKPDSEASCATFAFGSEKQCKLSYAVSGFGVWIFFLFLITSGISVFYVVKSKRNGQAPHPWLAANAQNSAYVPAMGDMNTIGKDPWDTSMNAHDGLDEEERRPYSAQDLTQAHETDDGRHPGVAVQWGPLGNTQAHTSAPNIAYDDTEYRGATPYVPTAAMSQPSYPSAAANAPAQDQFGTARSGGRQGRFSFSAEP